MAKIEVLFRWVQVLLIKEEDYISITDIARYKDAERTDYLISSSLRNRNTIDFLGIGVELNNPGFNPIKFGGNKKESGLDSFRVEGHAQSDRLRRLSQIAIQQMRILTSDGRLTRLDVGRAGGDA